MGGTIGPKSILPRAVVTGVAALEAGDEIEIAVVYPTPQSPHLSPTDPLLSTPLTKPQTPHVQLEAVCDTEDSSVSVGDRPSERVILGEERMKPE